MNALDTLITNNPDLSTLERAAYCAQTADAWRAYCAALEEELNDMGDQRAEAARLGEEMATAEEKLNAMEEEHAGEVADLEREISRLNDALQDAATADGAPEQSAPAAAPIAAVPAICSAGLPTVATHAMLGEIIELSSVDGDAVRVARRQYEDGSRAILAMFTRRGDIKRGRGIHRGNLLADGAELTPAALLESALKSHGWRVALYPRSAEQRAKLAGMGFEAIIQTAPGQFEPHPLGLAWAKPGAVMASGEQTAAPAPSEATPSGEEIAATCPTLIPGRWIPNGAENAERIAFDAALGAEVWLIDSSARPGALAVIAYAGKRTKHDAHYTMRDRARALQWAGEYMGKQQARAQRQAERRAEKAAKRAAGHKLKAGDVLRCSWGYDQTNIDYYEVTRLVGARMVEIRKIGAESVNDGGLSMTGDCVPRPGHYIGEPMRKAVSDYDGQSVRIASYASAHKIEPREVAGVKCYPVDHWTAYA